MEEKPNIQPKPAPNEDGAAAETSSSEQKSPKNNWIAKLSGKRTKLEALAAVLFVVAAGLFAFSSQYSLLKVEMAGQPINSTASPEELQNSISQRVENYKIPISYKGQTNSYKLQDAGISVDAEVSAQKALAAKKPSSLLKRLAFWQTESVPFELSVDEKKFEKFSAKYLSKKTQPAQNASLRINGGKVILQPEKEGRGYTLQNPKEDLLAHAVQLRSEPLVLTEQSIKPSITSQNVEATRQKAESLLAKRVVFDVAGEKIQATRADIGKWLEFTPVKPDKTIDLTVNSGKVLEYLDQIAAPYVHPPRNAIQLTKPTGGQTLIVGEDGVDIVGKEDIAASVAKQLTSSDSINEKLKVSYQKHKTISASVHDKWLVVDLTYKRMYAYEKTRLVKTFLVSAGAPETPTVEGQFRIYRKYRSQDMFGANVDGSRYFQPNVQYVNYFHADYAIHGNDWRPLSYFGNINSSHGCVGIVNADAAWIYDWAPIGTPVFTYS